jgi:hypothetical protein
MLLTNLESVFLAGISKEARLRANYDSVCREDLAFASDY